MQGPIVVGTDGSDTATQAVLEAATLAKVFDQPLHIVHTYKAQPLRVEGGAEAPAPVSSLSIADSVLNDVGSRARQSGASRGVARDRGGCPVGDPRRGRVGRR